MPVWLAVLIGSSLIGLSILILAAVLGGMGRHFDGIANMFFAISTMQLRLELEEYGYECPDWLKIMDEEEQPLDADPPTVLSLVKRREDKQEE